MNDLLKAIFSSTFVLAVDLLSIYVFKKHLLTQCISLRGYVDIVVKSKCRLTQI